MTFDPRRLLGLALVASLLAVPALADTTQAKGDSQAASSDGAKKKSKKKKDELPPVSDVIDGMKEIDGVLTLYRKKDKLLALVPNDKLDSPMLLATSIAGGGFFTGWQWTDMMISFERHDKKLLVMTPDTLHVTKKKGPVSDAVQRTHPGQLVGTLPILAADPNRGVVVNLGSLYTRQAPALIGFLAEGRDPSLSRLRSVKNFPQNAEVSVDLVSRPKGLEHGDIITVHYSLSSLPKSSYVPRLADNRVGYFLTVARDYSSDYRDDTTFVRMVNRWKLEKADPELDLSPPKEPIVFYIEKTVPTRYRRHVRDGIEEWNRAFEKIGFTGAIEVRQQTETQFADLDPEDVRYNFFRWITSDSAFAMGPSRVDPRTGQILDADIIFDDSMLRYSIGSWDLLLEESISETLSEQDERFLRANPGWDARPRNENGSPKVQSPMAKAMELFAQNAKGHVHEPFGSGRSACMIGRGRTREMGIAALHMGLLTKETEDDEKGGSKEWPEEFIAQTIKETVMHEVGHTLGLRHNFKASSWRPMDAMSGAANTSITDLCGSVMDYNPVNVAPEGEEQGKYQMTTLGPYDYWAIEYGYTTTGKGDPKSDKEAMESCAARGAEAGHDYGTDEDVGFGDPLINRWDLGTDPLDYTKSRVALARRIRDDVVERIVDEGESYDSARGAVNTLLSTLGYACNLAAGHVGGTYFHRDHRGDPGARDPIVVVPADKQREALAILSDNLFHQNAFDIPSDLLRKLPPTRWAHWGSEAAWEAEAAFPFHDRMGSMQSWSLYRLLSPTTLRRVLDSEAATQEGEDAFTLPDLFGELSGTIFSELEKAPNGGHDNRKPYIASLRRNLQRNYVGRLIDLTLRENDPWYPQAARTQAWYELKQLQGKLDKATSGGSRLDSYSRAHLEESKERIARALDASFQIGG